MQQHNKNNLLLLQKSMIGSWIINYRCSNCANDKYKVNCQKKDQVKSILYHYLFGLNICLIVASKVIIKKINWQSSPLTYLLFDLLLFVVWYFKIIVMCTYVNYFKQLSAERIEVMEHFWLIGCHSAINNNEM